MRQPCTMVLSSGTTTCDKPAVDYISDLRVVNGEEAECRLYLCAEHWNLIHEAGIADWVRHVAFVNEDLDNFD